MNEDFGVGRRRTADSAGPRHRYDVPNGARGHRPRNPLFTAGDGTAAAKPGHGTLPPPAINKPAGSPATALHPRPAKPASAPLAKPATAPALALKKTVSHIDVAIDMDDIDEPKPADAAPADKTSAWRQRLAEGRLGQLAARLAGKLSRRQWLMVGAAVTLLVGTGATAFAMLQPGDDSETSVVTQKKAAPKPLPPPPPVSPLTGMPVTAAESKHVVTAAMIENSLAARPQSGLQQAGVVYEAIAEYGVTRFMALYQEAKPGNLGPIRSVRPYYVDWSKIYDAPIAHVGGSPEALDKIKAEGVKDLDQFFNSGAYRRIGSRYAPHNVYTTMDELNKAAAGRGWTTSTFKAWPRKKDSPAATRTATKIDMNISSAAFNARFDYDTNNNNYKRSMAGAPHVDADSQAPIAPKVVIGLATSYGLQADGYHSEYRTSGSGSAVIFQDGIAIPATWTRQGNEQYSFVGADNKPVKLNAGQTWITVVGDPASVVYTP